MRRWAEKYRKDRSFLTKRRQWRRRAAEARIGVAAEEAAAVAAAVVVAAGAVVAAAAEHRAHRQQVGSHLASPSAHAVSSACAAPARD